MAYSQYSKFQEVIVFETGIKQAIGDISVPEDLELASIVLHLYKNGTLAGNEQIRINLHSTNRYNSPFSSSDWVSVSSIQGLTPNWIGRVSFSFNRVYLDSNETFYAEIETNNYTRNGDTFFLSIATDWPVVVNNIDASTGAPAKMELLGYK